MMMMNRNLVAAIVMAGALLAWAGAAAAQVPERPRNEVVVEGDGLDRPELLEPAKAGRLVWHAYPTLLRDAGVSGEVVLRVRVNEAGRAGRVTVFSSTHDLFLEGAQRVARQLRFRPAEAGGRTGEVTLRIIFYPEPCCW
ncbi:MAG TPA: TonB family protein [Longimicrobium sp.]|jgi:TonB family protein